MYLEDEEFDNLRGQDVDGFVILQRIGHGASSVVYQAMERAKDNRLVALKVMNETEQRLLAAKGLGNPFEREARFSRVVRDPSIVRIFRTGQLPDGRYYVAMEFVKGMTAEEELEHRKLIPWREAAQLMILAARAVGSLHEIDIIHRDLTPGNLMVRVGKDGQVRVKLIDFGIAKLSHERDDRASGVDSSTVGTPRYMAPETADGMGTDRRTDVYALGAILYELISGKPVIALKQPTSDRIVAYLKSDNPLPAVPLSDLVADLPDAIVDVVQRAVDRNPNVRPADANALASELQTIVDEIPEEVETSAIGKLANKVANLFRRGEARRGRFTKR